jgi:hypothetical protein
MSPSDMRPRPRNVMPTNSLARLSMRVDFRVVIVPRPGDGSVAYCVGAAGSTGVGSTDTSTGMGGSGVGGRGGSGVSGRGRILCSVLVTESEDHDERLMSLCLGLGSCKLRDEVREFEAKTDRVGEEIGCPGLPRCYIYTLSYHTCLRIRKINHDHDERKRWRCRHRPLDPLITR